MGNLRNSYPKTLWLVNISFYSISFTISKFDWSTVTSWNREELCFSKKNKMLKSWAINFNK